ncbi:MAG: DUF2752 domain-containing protein [Verrucomicrobiota bacterium]
MSSSVSPGKINRPSDPIRLVVPGVIFGAIFFLLLVARFFEVVPVELRPCSFREATGIPCGACGGTRSFRSLSSGDFRSAIAFHPVFVLGVFAAGGWFLWRLLGWWRGTPFERNPRPARLFGLLFTIGSGLFLLNWIYLIFFLP